MQRSHLYPEVSISIYPSHLSVLPPLIYHNDPLTWQWQRTQCFSLSWCPINTIMVTSLLNVRAWANGFPTDSSFIKVKDIDVHAHVVLSSLCQEVLWLQYHGPTSCLNLAIKSYTPSYRSSLLKPKSSMTYELVSSTSYSVLRRPFISS